MAQPAPHPTAYPECSHQVCEQAAVDRGDRRPTVCELRDSDAPVLQQCAGCGFSEKIIADGLCQPCTWNKENEGAL